MKIIIVKDSVMPTPAQELILYDDFLEVYVSTLDFKKILAKGDFNELLDVYEREMIVVHDLGEKVDEGIFSKKKTYEVIEPSNIDYMDL